MVVNIRTEDFENFYEIQDDLGRWVQFIVADEESRGKEAFIFFANCLARPGEEQQNEFYHRSISLSFWQTINRTREEQKRISIDVCVFSFR